MSETTKKRIGIVLILLAICIIGMSFHILDSNTEQLLKEMEQAYETGYQSPLDEVFWDYEENKIKYLNEEVEMSYKRYCYKLERENEKRKEQKAIEENNSYKNYVITNLCSEPFGKNSYKVRFTVTNIGERTATYIKFDIKTYDALNNVVNTEWTNWSGNLRPSESCIVETFVDMYGNEKSYSVILSEKRDS